MSDAAPVLLFIALSVCTSVGALCSAFPSRNRSTKVVLSVFAALSFAPGAFFTLVLFPEWFDPRHRTYKAFFRDIQEGMTREQVLARLEARYPAGGTRSQPKIVHNTPEELGFFMNPEGPREPNCEGIFLSFADERVGRKRYVAD
jgi:hypothetical protein